MSGLLALAHAESTDLRLMQSVDTKHGHYEEFWIGDQYRVIDAFGIIDSTNPELLKFEPGQMEDDWLILGWNVEVLLSLDHDYESLITFRAEVIGTDAVACCAHMPGDSKTYDFRQDSFGSPRITLGRPVIVRARSDHPYAVRTSILLERMDRKVQALARKQEAENARLAADAHRELAGVQL